MLLKTMTFVTRLAALLTLVGLCCAGQELAEVSGRVVDSVTKQGVAGAKVVLFRRTPNGFFSDTKIAEAAMKSDDPAAEMLAMATGPEGQFSFKATAPAAFMVFVKCDGYVNGQLTKGPGGAVRVKPGEFSGGLTIEIEKEGSISGRIIDVETGAPVRGMAVIPMVWRTGGGQRTLNFASGLGTTDAQGRYELKGLRPGDYLLKIQPPLQEKFLEGGTVAEFRDRVTSAYGRSYYPGVERREQASAVTLLAGGRTDGTDMKVAKRRVASIRGKVILGGPTGEIKEVRLSLTEMEFQGSTQSSMSVARGTWAVGRPFRLENLPPGRYWLMASAAAQGTESTAGANVLFEMDDRDVDNLELVLTQGMTVSGRVRLHELLKGPLSEERPPKVMLRPVGRSYTQWDMVPAEVEADGRFVRKSMMPGSYRFLVYPLAKGMAVGEVRYNGSLAERGVVTLNAGALEHKLELVIWPATASIAVTARQGMKAGADAQLVAVREPIDGEDPQADALITRADGEGRGRFENLTAGKYRVLAFPADANWRTDGRLAERLVQATVVEVDVGGAQMAEVKVVGQ